MSSEHGVVIIGGGISGMAAAWHLRKAGAQVTLVEARPYLGGRLASYVTPSCPTPFDNGPHLFLSTYTSARRLFKELGIADAFEYPYPGSIPFEAGNGQRAVLQEWPLPAPLNLTMGLLAFPLLSLQARLRIFKAATKLLNEKSLGGISAAEWLEANSQAEERVAFWNPLIRAAMNAPADAIPAKHLQMVFKEGFCKGIFGGRLGYAKEPLGRIFGEKAQQALEAAGVKVLSKAASCGADVQDGKITGIRLRSGEALPCAAAVAALPPWALAEWLKGVPEGNRLIEGYKLNDWKANSITTLYLWGDDRPLLNGYTCLPGKQVAWVFDFARLWGDRRAPVAVMVEGGGVGADLYVRPGQERARHASPLQTEDVLAEICASMPQLQRVRWTAWKVVSQKRATPLKPRALWGKTLPQVTAISNLFLAGDWLDPNLPPTVEAGVRVRCEAAEIILYKI